jgi:hypothetical protein
VSEILTQPLGQKWLFILPLPPSANKRTRPVRFGKKGVRQILTTEARNYLLRIGFKLKKWREATRRFRPVDSFQAVELWWILPNRNCDAHNYEKILYDALQRGGIVTNDKLLMPHHRAVEYDAKEPTVILCL